MNTSTTWWKPRHNCWTMSWVSTLSAPRKWLNSSSAHFPKHTANHILQSSYRLKACSKDPRPLSKGVIPRQSVEWSIQSHILKRSGNLGCLSARRTLVGINGAIRIKSTLRTLASSKTSFERALIPTIDEITMESVSGSITHRVSEFVVWERLGEEVEFIEDGEDGNGMGGWTHASIISTNCGVGHLWAG